MILSESLEFMYMLYYTAQNRSCILLDNEAESQSLLQFSLR